MAAIQELIQKIQDPTLRHDIEVEVNELQQQKNFGLVYEQHLPENVPMYEVSIRRGYHVALRGGDINDVWLVVKVEGDRIHCVKPQDGGASIEQIFMANDLVVVSRQGEAIYPYLIPIDNVKRAPNSDLWHQLIQADNYLALQLLAYLYPGMVDCIYIDPPYNTGAHDWKYNNDYVDASDIYRHSKWLSMMEKRLRLAKKLLNPADSVLIVTIDEKEYQRLGCLLEEIFPEARIQMISILTNPKGVTRGGFRRADEYIYFVMFGQAAPCRLQLGEDWSPSPNKTKQKSKKKKTPDWTSMMRRGSHSSRLERDGLYYAIYVDPVSKTIQKIGRPLDLSLDKDEEIEGLVQIIPLRSNGEQGCWQVGPEELKNRIEQGRIRLGKKTSYGFVVNYLPDGAYNDVVSDKFHIEGRASDGSLIAYRIDLDDPDDMIAPSQWKIALHNSSEQGSTLLNNILGDRFEFPKSLYAVHDTLRFFVANKPNAIILDFFAGSGTTLHAVNLLNEEDGGHRRCIMVTNNEVSEKEEKTMTLKGLRPGDKEWEQFGIAQYVNWPRTVCTIEGHDINGNSLKGDYQTSLTEESSIKRSIKQIAIDVPSDRKGNDIRKQISAIADKKEKTAFLFDVDNVDDFMEELDEETETIYIVTSDNKKFKAAKKALDELPELTRTVMVKRPMKDGFEANVNFFRLSFLDPKLVGWGKNLQELLTLLWLQSGAHGECPTKVEAPYAILPENKMALLIDEKAFAEFSSKLSTEIETAYIAIQSDRAYQQMIAQLRVKNTYQLYGDYLNHFKTHIGGK